MNLPNGGQDFISSIVLLYFDINLLSQETPLDIFMITHFKGHSYIHHLVTW